LTVFCYLYSLSKIKFLFLLCLVYHDNDDIGLRVTRSSAADRNPDRCGVV